MTIELNIPERDLRRVLDHAEAFAFAAHRAGPELLRITADIRTELKRAATSVAARIADEYAAADPENEATDSQRTHERRTNLISRAELLAVRTERVDISGIRYGRAVPSGPGATAVFHRFVDASLLAYNDTRDGARAVRRISAAEAGEDLEYIRAERARTDKIPHGEESERASPDKPHWPTRHHSDPAQSRARRRTGTVAMSFCGAAIATDQATEDWKDVDCGWCIRKKARLDAVDLTTLPLLYKRERARRRHRSRLGRAEPGGPNAPLLRESGHRDHARARLQTAVGRGSHNSRLNPRSGRRRAQARRVRRRRLPSRRLRPHRHARRKPLRAG